MIYIDFLTNTTPSLYKLLLFCFVIFASHTVVSQSITGIIYDDKAIVEGVVVKNLSTKMATISTKEGRFEITARAQDSISFEIFTHDHKLMVIKEGVSYTDIVIELTRKVNELDEVIIKKEVKPVFKKEEFADTFESQLQKHIELYPEQYEFNSNPNNNLNFVNIGKRLWRLIKKEKSKPPPFVPIKLEEYIGLFKEDPVINDRFLIETIKIPFEFKPLFIDFCVSKNVDSELLKEKNKFLLIDEFINLGKEFKEVLETDVND